MNIQDAARGDDARAPRRPPRATTRKDQGAAANVALEIRVEAAKHGPSRRERRTQLGVGLDDLGDRRLRTRLGHARRTSGHPGDARGAERRTDLAAAMIDERAVERRGDDAAPVARARIRRRSPTARRSGWPRARARRARRRARTRRPRAPRGRRPRDVDAPSSPKKTPRCPGVVVRRALAGQVRQHHEPAPARRGGAAALDARAAASPRLPRRRDARRTTSVAAPDKVTAMRCQRVGDAMAERVHARAQGRAGRIVGDEDHARRAEREEAHRLRRSTPMPTAPQALSPPPPATGNPGGESERCRGVARQAGRRRAVPSTSARHLRARQAGMRRAARPTSRACATSSHSVPDASEGSLTNSPVSAQPQPVLRQQHPARCAAKVSGSCSRHPDQLGRGEAGHREVAGDRTRLRGSRALEARACAAERPSFHRIAGPQHRRRCASSSTAPCIWPDSPMARTCRRRAPSRAHRGPRCAATSRRGSCSDHGGCGCARSSGDAASCDDGALLVDQHGLDATTFRGRCRGTSVRIPPSARDSASCVRADMLGAACRTPWRQMRSSAR